MKTRLRNLVLLFILIVNIIVPLANIGNIKASAQTTNMPTAADYLGTTSSAIVNELKSHESDGYYLGTPYVGLYTDPTESKYLSPNGSPTSFGPGMNCTGFVAYVLQKSGADLSKIRNNSSGFGGIANAFNWKDVLSANALTLTYDSIPEMLSSGELQKGDIIFFDPDRSVTGYDSHIGFFWGDTPSENKFWHSYDPGGNQISEIKEKTPTQKYYVFKNSPITSDVKIAKVDKDSGAYVPGTTFRVEFSGKNAPENQEVTTGSDGTVTIPDVRFGVHVKATEISVPKPYVLASSVGESDTIEGDVTSAETLVLTAKNSVAKGQITIEKFGVETGKTAWNSNYTLKGNVFEVHKDNETGEVVSTITTDEKGHAETPNNLPLGNYVVTEKTASNGFVNTFKPVAVSIEYANQTTAVIIKGTEGTNQEVVGSTLLTKEDAETGAKTQGKATFDGATYGLFHQDGTPVKWSENFKPVSSKGNKLEGDDIQFEISDKQQQASVEHLALGNYYWQELIAPEGYQIDNTKREFAVTYKDQDTKVIETAATSKENVVKFKLDGFKYLESKGGEVASGYNGIDFTLTPVKPTKGEVQTTTTKTDANGYDGYWSFEVPYGDYTMSEVKAPEGYKTIKDLHIKSSFDSEKREYTFTITENSQKEPIKTLTVAEADINKGSNVISLSKLFLTNKVQEIPEMPTIETLFATKDGSKDFDPSIDQELPDKVKATVPAEDIGKTFYYVTQFHKIDAEGKDTVVGTDESEHVAKDLSYEFDATYNYKANTLKDGEKLVATHIVYKDKEHKEEYAKHFDLTNEKQTLTAKTPATPITPTTPAGSSRSIPQTSGSLGGSMMWVVLGLVLASIGGFLVYRNKKNAVKE